MESVINTIIEIEKQAQELIQDCRVKREHLSEEIRNEAESMRQKYMSRAAQRLQKVEAAEKEYMESSLQSLLNSHQEQMTKIDAMIRDKMDFWVEDIFSRIINR